LDVATTVADLVWQTGSLPARINQRHFERPDVAEMSFCYRGDTCQALWLAGCGSAGAGWFVAVFHLAYSGARVALAERVAQPLALLQVLQAVWLCVNTSV
jgi:hypothetical protein